ncbi:MAG: hypothetical protein HC837_10270 [Chloroflexaceae bacterium]|nr:hypothetical protein [Chloroflexaceae bacterium]
MRLSKIGFGLVLILSILVGSLVATSVEPVNAEKFVEQEENLPLNSAYPAPGAVNANTLIEQVEYPVVYPGETFRYFIRILNTGNTTWSGKNGYGWRGTDMWESTSALLKRDVPPGEDMHFRVSSVRAPDQPGVYRYGFIMNQWGEDFGTLYYLDVTVLPQETQVRQKTLVPRVRWSEPEDGAYVNYCGPLATQVALDAAGVDIHMIPSLYDIGVAEYINPNVGVRLDHVASALNGYLTQAGKDASYQYARAGQMSDLESMIVRTVDNNRALITGVKTGNMPGWNGWNVNHIVAVIGYRIDGQHVEVYYYEGASELAGYTGKSIQNVSLEEFWGFVSGFSEQATY